MEIFQGIIRDSKDLTQAVRHITFILGEIGKTMALVFINVFFDHLNMFQQKPFAISLTHAKVIHHSYLHSLSLIGYSGLGGAVIIDHLIQGPNDVPQLKEYLSLITPQEAADLLPLASSLIGASPQQIKNILHQHPYFPYDYLTNINPEPLFTPDRIANLVVRVCEAKSLEIPAEIKEIRIKNFFVFLTSKFQIKQVHTNDFLAMVRESLIRFSLGPQVAIHFFAHRIPQLAEFLGEEADLDVPLPDPEPGAEVLSFTNPPCATDHSPFDSALDGVRRVITCDDLSIGILIDELSKADFIALMHHEPPFTMAHSVRIDMVSFCTKSTIFHVLATPTPIIFRRVLNIIREYSERGIVFVRNPQGLLRILLEDYAWRPRVYDIRPSVDGKVERVNSSVSDLARYVFGSPLCWAGRYFSAHVRPSRVALRHREIHLAAIFMFGQRFGQEIVSPGVQSGVPSSSVLPPIDARHVVEQREEARRQEDRRREEEEERAQRRRDSKQQKEEEERRQKRQREEEQQEKLRQRRREIEDRREAVNAEMRQLEEEEARLLPPPAAGGQKRQKKH